LGGRCKSVDCGTVMTTDLMNDWYRGRRVFWWQPLVEWARILSRFRDRRHSDFFALILLICRIQEWFDWKRSPRNFT